MANFKRRTFDGRRSNSTLIKTYQLSRKTVPNIVAVIKLVLGQKVWMSWELDLGKPKRARQNRAAVSWQYPQSGVASAVGETRDPEGRTARIPAFASDVAAQERHTGGSAEAVDRPLQLENNRSLRAYRSRTRIPTQRGLSRRAGSHCWTQRTELDPIEGGRRGTVKTTRWRG